MHSRDGPRCSWSLSLLRRSRGSVIHRSLISITQSGSSELKMEFPETDCFPDWRRQALWRRLLVIGYGAIQYGSTEGCWCESYPRLLGCWLCYSLTGCLISAKLSPAPCGPSGEASHSHPGWCLQRTGWQLLVGTGIWISWVTAVLTTQK